MEPGNSIANVVMEIGEAESNTQRDARSVRVLTGPEIEDILITRRLHEKSWTKNS